MAKKQTDAASATGPVLAAAIFCDSSIVDKDDGALSIIRIVDRFTIYLSADAPINVPSETHRLPYELKMVLMFKTAGCPGDHKLDLQIVNPEGQRKPFGEPRMLAFSDDPTGGVNLRVKVGLQIARAGVYWVDVLLDDKQVTRMPFEIIVQREARQNPPADVEVRSKPKKTKR